MTTREADLMVRANRSLANKGETKKLLDITLPLSQGGCGVIKLAGGYTYTWNSAPAATSTTEGRIPDGTLSQLVAFVSTIVIPAAGHAEEASAPDAKKNRIAELEDDFRAAAKVADCGILDLDAARVWMCNCEEYKRLVWEVDGLLPDNCTDYCRVRGRASEVIEEAENG